MTTMTIYYCDDLAWAYSQHASAPPKYTLEHECEVELGRTDAVALEEAFARFNRGSGVTDPVLDEKQMRSLSMGDIVKLRDDAGVRLYRCVSQGWVPVEAFDLVEEAQR